MKSIFVKKEVFFMDIALPEYANAYNGYILMKFTSKLEYQQNFLDGKLFCNELDWFAKCENLGQGDPNEGSSLVENIRNPNYQSLNLKLINGDVFIVQSDYSKNPESYKRSTIYNYSSAENRKVKIICFYTSFINYKNYTIHNFPQNITTMFGNYGVLILDRIEFFNRLSNAFKSKPEYNPAIMGFVNYVDLQPGINEWNPFKKEAAIFGYQNEFRIAFKSDCPGPITLDLGSIRDIAIPLLAKDVNEIHFQDGKLQYPLYKMI